MGELPPLLQGLGSEQPETLLWLAEERALK